MHGRKCQIARHHTQSSTEGYLPCSTGSVKADMLILTVLHYLSYTNQDQCPLLKMARTHACTFTHTCICMCVYIYPCRYTLFSYPVRKNLLDFQQNFTPSVESHMLILKPTITFSWFFFSKWSFITA